VPLNNIDILFRTSLFNLSQVGPNFKNPGCFGEDAAAWFAAKLKEHGFDISALSQEDWGWEFSASKGPDAYHLGFGGYPDGDESDPNEGEWRIIVNKDRSFADQFFGRKQIDRNDTLVELIETLLRSESAIQNVERANES
jgi:hypothetical protein